MNDPARVAASGWPVGAARSNPFSGEESHKWLRRLMFAGICVPVVIVIGLQLLRPHFFVRWWPNRGDLILNVLTALVMVAFGLVMFLLINRGYQQLVRRNAQLAAVNDVLLRLDGDSDGETVRRVVIEHAIDLLKGSNAGFWSVHTADDPHNRHEFALTSRLRGEPIEMLWVSRSSGTPFDVSDQCILDTLADLAAVSRERDRLREAEQDAAIVAERLRISREMHDSLAQVLAVTHLRLRALSSTEMPPTTAGELCELADLCEEAYGDVRETIFGLRESARDDSDLAATMARYLAWYSDRTGIDARFDGQLEALPMTGHAAVHTLRIMQEALTNVRKHADATAVQVTVEAVNSAAVRVAVDDNGHGFDIERMAPGDHYGLLSMRERAESLGGTFAVESHRGRGTRVIVEIPVGGGRHRAPADPRVLPARVSA